MSHEWGPCHTNPFADVSQCLRCGIIRSNAQIAATNTVIPPCGKPK